MSSGTSYVAAPPAAAGRAAARLQVLTREGHLGWTALSVLAIGAVGVFAKFPEAILPIATDTGMFATYARMLLHGDRPYVDFYDIHPPLGFLYWVVVELIGGTDWSRMCVGAWGTSLAPQPCVNIAAQVLDLALTFLAAALTYGIARRLGLRPLVGWLAALFVVWFANESMISMEGSTPTKLTLVPCTLAVYAYLRAFAGGSRRWAVLSGAAAMLGVMAKQPALVTLVALLLYMTPGLLRRGKLERRVLGGLAIGGAVVLVPTLIYMGLIGSLEGFWLQPWFYNVQRFVGGYWQTPAGLTSPATRIDRVIGQSAGVLFVGALLGCVALLFGASEGRQRLLLVWAVCSLVAIAGFREFAQVVPSLALVAALGIGRLWDEAGRNGLGLGRPVAGRFALVTVFGTIFLLTSGFQLVELRRAQFERGPQGKPADPELIATYLRQNAPPGPIFTWGNEAQIYALSDREPASRYLITEFPRLGSPWSAASRAQLLEDLRQHPPAAIVIDPHADEPELRLSAFPELTLLIDRCYTRVSAMPSQWLVYTQTAPGCSL